VSIVICSRNRAEMLARALPRVRSVMRPADELIVVDSASTDATVGVVAAENADTVVRTGRPGLGHARNAGWQRARHDVVAFTDDDCEPDDGWPAALAVAIGSERGFVFGSVVAGGGSGEPLSVTSDDVARSYDSNDVLRAQSFGHGANFACRREALVAVGGFDDELGAGSPLPAGEDTDIVLRMLLAGWSGGFDPRPVVRHELWRDRRRALRVMFNYGVGAGACAAKARRLGVDASLLRQELVDRGVKQAWRDLRNRYEYGVVASLARTLGVAVGGYRGARLDLVDGRFRR
jgi:glycosyltransferase involved in cell wall biosynthesis